MNNQCTVRILAATLLVSLVTSPLLAQAARQKSPEPEAGARALPEQGGQMITAVLHGRTISMARPRMLKPTQENFEQFRSDLIAILNIQKETTAIMQIDINDRLDPAIQQAAALQLSDVQALQQGIVDLTSLKEAVLQQKGLVTTQGYTNRVARTTQFSPNDPFPGAETASVCPLPITTQAAFTSGLVLLTAGFVKALAADACNQIISVLVAGGNLALLCIITDVIYFAARIIDYPIQFCYNDGTSGQILGTFNRLEYIHNQLNYSIANDNTNKALLSTQLTNAENHIVTNDNNNKTALSSQTASFQTLVVRASIQRNLAANPATTFAVGLFQLPASQGGYLEMARQELIDTYNARVAAAGPGVTVYNPASELSLGASFTAQGKYREAYYYYRRGFRSVVKYP